MIAFKISLWLLAYTIGIARLSMSIILHMRHSCKKSFWEIAFFSVFTVLLISLSNFETILSIKGIYHSFWSMMSIACFALTTMTLPVHIHHSIPDLKALKLRNAFFIILSSINLIPLMLSFIFYHEGLYSLTYYITLLIMSTSIMYSMILLIVKEWKKPWKEKYKLPLISFISVPLCVGVDLFFFENNSFIMLPLFYSTLCGIKLLEDVKSLSKESKVKLLSQDKMAEAGLTKREKEVAALLVAGHTYQQAADKLFISLPTVKTHAFRIYSKTNAQNKMDLLQKIGQ